MGVAIFLHNLYSNWRCSADGPPPLYAITIPFVLFAFIEFFDCFFKHVYVLLAVSLDIVCTNILSIIPADYAREIPMLIELQNSLSKHCDISGFDQDPISAVLNEINLASIVRAYNWKAC